MYHVQILNEKDADVPSERRCGVPGPRKCGRGTKKQLVFGTFERGGRVFTEIVLDVKSKTFQDVIREKISF